MSEQQVRHLMVIVRRRLWQAGISPGTQREYDDMLAVAYLAAWRAVERMPAGSPFSWQTMAGQAGQAAARSYLWRKVSGRLGTRQTLTTAYRARWHRGQPPTTREINEQLPPLLSSALAPEEWQRLEPAWDGGIAAADARLQLWIWRPRLTAAQREILALIYGEGLTMSEASRRLGIAIPSAQHRYNSALKKYRKLIEAERAAAAR